MRTESFLWFQKGGGGGGRGMLLPGKRGGGWRGGGCPPAAAPSASPSHEPRRTQTCGRSSAAEILAVITGSFHLLAQMEGCGETEERTEVSDGARKLRVSPAFLLIPRASRSASNLRAGFLWSAGSGRFHFAGRRPREDIKEPDPSLNLSLAPLKPKNVVFLREKWEKLWNLNSACCLRNSLDWDWIWYWSGIDQLLKRESGQA